MDYKLQNLSSTPLKVKLVYNGPTLPPEEGSRGADRQILTAIARTRKSRSCPTRSRS